MVRLKLFIFFLLSVSINILSAQTQPGFLDLSHEQWDQRSIHQLNGIWDFFPEMLSLNGLDEEPLGIEVPDNWMNYSVKGEDFPLYSYGTFRLLLKLPAAGLVYGLRLNRIFTSYSLYLNGEKVLEVGKAGDSTQNSWAKIQKQTYYFVPETDTVEILIAVSNFRYYKGGIVDPVEIGEAQAIQRVVFLRGVLDLLLTGIIMGFSIYHLLLYLIVRRTDTAPLYFSLICLLVIVQLLFEGEMHFSSLFPSLSLTVEESIQTVEHLLFLPFLLLLIQKQFSQRIPRFLLIPISCLMFLASLLIIVLPFSYLIPIWNISSVVIMISLIYIVYYLIIQFKNHQLNSGIFLVSFLIFTVTGVHDILISLNILDSSFILVYGLAFLFVTQAVIIARRYNAAWMKVGILSGQLSLRNEELEKSYHQVEDQVKVRTQQLLEANKKIAWMNHQLEKEKKQLEKEVVTDNLTGLLTKKAVKSQLRQILLNEPDKIAETCVCMLDLDFFKAVNDLHGHQTGDEVLKKMGEIIRLHTRGMDLPGRFGGEEFILVLPGTGQANGQRIAERIRTAVETAEWSVSELKLTISCGIAIQEADDTEDGMIARADKLLYEAKKQGRNRVLCQTIPE